MPVVKIWKSLLIIILTGHCGFGQNFQVLNIYTEDDGLSDNFVHCAVQDHQGFLWFGTAGGLDRFDGYSFKSFQHDPKDSTSILPGRITDLEVDDRGYLWLASSNGGLQRFDPATELAARFPSDGNVLPNEITGNFLYDAPNTLWLGHRAGGGLSRFDMETEEVINYLFESDSALVLRNNVLSIHRDNAGRIWAGTYNGLYQYDSIANYFRRYTIDHLYTEKTNPVLNAIFTIDDFETNKLLVSTWYGPLVFDINAQEFTILLEPGPGDFLGPNRTMVRDQETYWISDPNDGIYRYNSGTGQMDHIGHRELELDEKWSQRIYPLLLDNSNTLWLVSWDQGLISMNVNPNKFKHFRLSSLEERFPNNIWSIFRDHQDYLWIGTDDGLFKLEFDYQAQKVLSYEHLLPGLKITSIVQDSKNSIWVGAEPRGLFKYDPETKSIDQYLPENNDSNNHWIVEVYVDRDDRIWLGMGTNCLVEFNPDTNKFIYYPCENKLAGVNCILEDSFGNLWVGGIGIGGFMAFDRSNGEFITLYDEDVWITSLFEDQGGILWIGAGAGLYSLKLNYLDSLKKTEKTTRFINHTGKLPSSLVFEVQSHQNQIWLSLKSELIKIETASGAVTSFDKYDGVLPKFNTLASFRDDSGILYFGGPDGLTYFHPDSIAPSSFVPRVVLTDFQVSNRSIAVNDSISGRVVLNQVISTTEQVTLPFGENFTIEFSALDFTNPEENIYSYKLDGVDKDWSPPGNKRTATYTRLWEGDYVFRVKGSNHDGIWNPKETAITISILPPVWRTWWAYLFYSTIIIGICWIIFHFFMARERLKSRLAIEKLEVEKVKEMDLLKTQFFANVSHEFRTPLTLILGPIKQMYEGTFKGDTQVVLGVIVRNGRRLLHLVNQLLDFSKLEAGGMPLQASIGDLTEFTRMMFANFESKAHSQNIRYVFQSEVSSLPAYFDKEKLEKVIINLLDNAFKFTPKGGFIYLKLSKKPSKFYAEGLAEICIEDSGKGISREKLPHIFNRFYQVNDTNTREQEGTGIGLALAKDLVELHQGTITAQSTLNKGTSIIVQLPLGKDHLLTTQIVSGRGYQPAFDIISEATMLPTSANGNENLPLLLIIDDNQDMLYYIEETLCDSFQLMSSQNGNEGWENALEYTPDLIISDVMMPGMDGYTLCEKLKTDERTSHIPVILLTARAGEKAKLEGLETGADDYITKPFSPRELRVRVQNLIELRHKLREQYSKGYSLIPPEIPFNSADERFLQRALDILEINRADANFDSETFAREIGMSRSQLHRKLKALTDQPTGDFIRSYRLNYASQLILKNYSDIAQISYECGFNSPSYFTSCFKKKFGMVPSEYGASSSANSSSSSSASSSSSSSSSSNSKFK